VLFIAKNILCVSAAWRLGGEVPGLDGFMKLKAVANA